MQFVIAGALVSACGCGGTTKANYQEQGSEAQAKADNNIPFYLKKPNYVKAAKLNVQLGYGYLKQKNYARAKSKFVHALELQPKSADVHAGLAEYYRLVGENNQAEPHYLKAIEYSTKKAEYRNNYGIYLCDIGKIDEAKKELLEAIAEKTYTGVALTYQNLCSCMASHKDMASAEQYYKQALRHDPYQFDGMLELSKISLANKQYESAWNYYVQYKNNVSLNADALYHGAKLAAELGDDDASASLGLMLKSKYPDSFEYKKYLQFVKKSMKV